MFAGQECANDGVSQLGHRRPSGWKVAAGRRQRRLLAELGADPRASAAEAGPPGRHVRAGGPGTGRPAGGGRRDPRIPPRHRPGRDRVAGGRVGAGPARAGSAAEDRRAGRAHPAGQRVSPRSPARTVSCSRCTCPRSTTWRRSWTGSCCTGRRTARSWSAPRCRRVIRPGGWTRCTATSQARWAALGGGADWPDDEQWTGAGRRGPPGRGGTGADGDRRRRRVVAVEIDLPMPGIAYLQIT